MATATAAPGLTLEAMKRRPIAVRARTKATPAVNSTMTKTVSGTPKTRARPNALSGGGTCWAKLPETNWVAPSISEFTPMVVTSAGTPRKVTSTPLKAPTTSPMARANRT